MTPLLYFFAACVAIDGDTLRCDGERVRLARIDTPERHQPGFQEAKDAMRLLIDGQTVTCQVKTRDRYGRLLGECGTADTPSLSDEMLRRRLAVRYRGRK